MNENSIFVKNEHEANRFAAKIMLITIAFIVFVYVLNVVDIFAVPKDTMTIAMGSATVFLLIPAFLTFVVKTKAQWVKYVTVAAAVIMVSLLNMFLSFNVVIMYIYPIAIASLYFSRRLSWFGILFSIVFLSISQFFSLSAGGVADENIKNVFDNVVLVIMPRNIELFALALIFISLSKRTKKMLESVMGAEEQKHMLERIRSITKKSYEVSRVLADSVKQLSIITDHTTEANEHIAENTSKIASGSEDTLNFVNEASDSVQEMSNGLNMIAKEGKAITEISNKVNKMTEDNAVLIGSAVSEMHAIDKATGQSREMIFKLGERSNEIGRIVELITGISGQTNLLALNAAIESARAGEQGKGFAVVAEEIRKLAEQSEKAAKDIANLIKQVLEDTQVAVDSMDTGSKKVEKGLEVISEAGRTFDEVSAVSREMNDKVQQLSCAATDAAANGDKVVSVVHRIKEINNKNLGDLQGIAAATEEQLASMQQVGASVDSIERISNELLDVVKETDTKIG